MYVYISNMYTHTHINTHTHTHAHTHTHITTVFGLSRNICRERRGRGGERESIYIAAIKFMPWQYPTTLFRLAYARSTRRSDNSFLLCAIASSPCTRSSSGVSLCTLVLVKQVKCVPACRFGRKSACSGNVRGRSSSI